MLTTSQGMKIAYVSPNVDFESVKSLEVRTECEHGDFQGVDILLSSDWPMGLGSGDDQVKKTDGISLISRVAVKYLSTLSISWKVCVNDTIRLRLII